MHEVFLNTLNALFSLAKAPPLDETKITKEDVFGEDLTYASPNVGDFC